MCGLLTEQTDFFKANTHACKRIIFYLCSLYTAHLKTPIKLLTFWACLVDQFTGKLVTTCIASEDIRPIGGNKMFTNMHNLNCWNSSTMNSLHNCSNFYDTNWLNVYAGSNEIQLLLIVEGVQKCHRDYISPNSTKPDKPQHYVWDRVQGTPLHHVHRNDTFGTYALMLKHEMTSCMEHKQIL